MSAALPNPVTPDGSRSSSHVLSISVVIPCLNAARTLEATIASLGQVAECIIVDGGSEDATREIAAAAGVQLLSAPKGRGAQIRAGVAASTAPWILILHADTRLSANWRETAREHMSRPGHAGWFRFVLDSAAPQARRLERFVALRSRLGLPFGDQGLLIHRRLLSEVGGVNVMPLMEDVDLVRRIGRSRLRPLRADAVTSADKWERDGWWKRSARNQLCLAMYFAGASPERLIRLYR